MGEEVTVPEVKPGYKTTEFWMAAAASVFGMLYASGAFVAGGQADHWVGLVVTALATQGYSWSRGKVKSA